VVGVVPLVENMLSGAAYRPGDVVRTMAGLTVEVVDTDAEGRLILIDALHYALRRFRPSAVIDLATLTGSVVRALGHVYAGLFANDDRLAEALVRAGRRVGERLWRLPLDPEYDEHLKSEIADIRQCAPDADSADAVHAAQLLQRFVGGTPWAHLDIAGKDFERVEGRPNPVAATGFGVRLLDAYLADIEAGQGD
jgi:leucyl aminopeptidase